MRRLSSKPGALSRPGRMVNLAPGHSDWLKTSALQTGSSALVCGTAQSLLTSGKPTLSSQHGWPRSRNMWPSSSQRNSRWCGQRVSPRMSVDDRGTSPLITPAPDGRTRKALKASSSASLTTSGATGTGRHSGRRATKSGPRHRSPFTRLARESPTIAGETPRPLLVMKRSSIRFRQAAPCDVARHRKHANPRIVGSGVSHLRGAPVSRTSPRMSRGQSPSR